MLDPGLSFFFRLRLSDEVSVGSEIAPLRMRGYDYFVDPAIGLTGADLAFK